MVSDIRRKVTYKENLCIGCTANHESHMSGHTKRISISKEQGIDMWFCVQKKCFLDFLRETIKVQELTFSSEKHWPLSLLASYTDAIDEFQTSCFSVWQITFSQCVKFLQKIGGRENAIVFCQIIFWAMEISTSHVSEENCGDTNQNIPRRNFICSDNFFGLLSGFTFWRLCWISHRQALNTLSSLELTDIRKQKESEDDYRRI